VNLKRRVEQLEAAAPPTLPSLEAGRACEALYLQELEWYEAGESGLIHDPEAEIFYTQGGEFALSRHRVRVGTWVNG